MGSYGKIRLHRRAPGLSPRKVAPRAMVGRGKRWPGRRRAKAPAVSRRGYKIRRWEGAVDSQRALGTLDAIADNVCDPEAVRDLDFVPAVHLGGGANAVGNESVKCCGRVLDR